MNESLT